MKKTTKKQPTNAPIKGSKRNKSGMTLTDEETKAIKAGGFRLAIRHAAW